MGCKWCDEGYYPAVNVNGAVIHRTPPTHVVARVEGDRFVPVEVVYKSGIEVCTKRGLCLVVRAR
jgi:hypothetical protein